MARLTAKYATEGNNKAAKLFREDYYATSDMFEVGISEILAEQAASKEKDSELKITERMIKVKMHQLFFDEGMGAFKTRKATPKAKELCKELLPEFYVEMVVTEEKTANKKEAAPKKNSAPKKPTVTKEDKKKADSKEAAKSTTTAARKSAGPGNADRYEGE